MTPPEEIEAAIAACHQELKAVNEPITLAAIGGILAALYQARAIERLEATVRAIGVQMQEKPGEFRISEFRTWGDPHAFRAQPVDRSKCYCGQPRLDPIHPAELPRCIECLMPLYLEHQHACSRPGSVSKDDTV